MVQSASEMLAAITAVLADTVPRDRGELMQWAVNRLLLGVAHERGFMAAAQAAYLAADTLAGGVR